MNGKLRYREAMTTIDNSEIVPLTIGKHRGEVNMLVGVRTSNYRSMIVPNQQRSTSTLSGRYYVELDPYFVGRPRVCFHMPESDLER